MHSWYSKPDTRQNCPFFLRYTLIPYIACLLMHSWYSKPDTRQNCPFFLRYTLIPYIACLLDDMSSAEDYLQNVKENPEVEDIDYTVILPGGLINKPVTDLEFAAIEGEWFVPNGGRIHRE